MSVILNVLICMGSLYSIIMSIKDNDSSLLIYSTTIFIISLINTISLINKNKYIYRLENNYFLLIEKVKSSMNKNDNTELKKIMNVILEDSWYKNMKIENAEYPELEKIK